MIIKIRVTDIDEIKRVLVSGRKSDGYSLRHGFFAAEILEVTPELTEKEKLLSQLFGDPNLCQSTKEVLAQIVNKAYEKK